VALLAPNLLGATGKRAKGEFGLMVGFLDGMTIKFGSKGSDPLPWHVESDAGIAGGIFFDQKAFRTIWAGMSIDYYRVRKDTDLFENPSAGALNLALRLSLRLRSADGKWVIRPGVATGVALLGEVFAMTTTQHWTLKPFVEVVYYVSPKVGLITEMGVFNTLQGGNDDVDITSGPAVTIRFGLLL
jgi:hypothetical protein